MNSQASPRGEAEPPCLGAAHHSVKPPIRSVRTEVPEDYKNQYVKDDDAKAVEALKEKNRGRVICRMQSRWVGPGAHRPALPSEAMPLPQTLSDAHGDAFHEAHPTATACVFFTM